MVKQGSLHTDPCLSIVPDDQDFYGQSVPEKASPPSIISDTNVLFLGNLSKFTTSWL